MNPDRFERVLQRGLKAGDWTAMEEFITDQSSFTYNYGAHADDEPFDSAVFQRLVELLDDSEFLQSTRSSNVLCLLQYDWSVLTRGQKRQLFPKLVGAYPRLHDNLSLFIVAELLGEYFADKPALDALRSLNGRCPLPQRSLIPMALERIARQEKNRSLALMAITELNRLQSDPVAEVRDEAVAALSRLKGGV